MSNEKQSFAQSVWNSSTGEFLGRNGTSWLKVTLFYTVFYVFLSAFWAVFLFIFYQTVSKDGPLFTLEGIKPGVGFQPDLSGDHSIWLKKDGENVKYWFDGLSSFLEPYENITNSLITSYPVEQCDNNTFPEKGKFCLFDIEKISQNCSRENKFGYQNGQPCVLIKLNRPYNWLPESYSDYELKNTSNIPEFVRNEYPKHASANQSIYITCEGESSVDKQHIGPLSYYPENQGIEFKYFPFSNQPGYLSPFVFVQFTKPTPKVSINVVCTAWAKNLDPEESSVSFELRTDFASAN